MASANEAGLLRVVIEDASGNQYVCHQFRSDGAINAGKSPDGVLANLTIDKQMKIGMHGPIGKGGSKVRLFFKFDSADGLDASDGVVAIGVTEVTPDGRPISERQLSASDIGYTTDLPASTPAGSWIELGTGYNSYTYNKDMDNFTIPDGMFVRVGSATLSTPTVISIEDDTA